MRTVVVGAGIVGASTAFHLTQLGAEVYFIDSDAPGRATFAGAGIVCPWLSQNRDPRYEELSFAAVRYYPELVAKLAAAGETGIAYDLVGGLVVANSIDQLDSVVQRLQKHLEHGVKEIGQVRLLHAGGPKELFPYLDSELVGIYLSGAARVSGETPGHAAQRGTQSWCQAIVWNSRFRALRQCGYWGTCEWRLSQRGRGNRRCWRMVDRSVPAT
jgi:D-amino-acid dehydrogenase